RVQKIFRATPSSQGDVSMRLTKALLAVAALAIGSIALADDWPQWIGPKRDAVWRETGIVEKLPKNMKPKWRAAIGGGYAGPAIAGGKVFVHDRTLDEGQKDPANPFSKTNSKGKE